MAKSVAKKPSSSMQPTMKKPTSIFKKPTAKVVMKRPVAYRPKRGKALLFEQETSTSEACCRNTIYEVQDGREVQEHG